jgi:hypothetical protein
VIVSIMVLHWLHCVPALGIEQTHTEHGVTVGGEGAGEAGGGVSKSGEYTNLDIHESSDPHALAVLSCAGSLFESCYDLSKAAIELEKNRLFEHPLVDWTYSDICGCYMPPREKKKALQFLHIPKTGTSFNYILHDYFDCLSLHGLGSDGCADWLDGPDALRRGLCGGRLFSCQGHRTNPNLPTLVSE